MVQNDSELVVGPGSHLVRHNDPPRSQAPSIIDQSLPQDHATIDHFRYNTIRPDKMKKFPPPRLRILDMDFDEPSLILRSVDRVKTWGLGTYHFFANMAVAYDVASESKGGNRDRHDANVIYTIQKDCAKVSSFMVALLLVPPIALGFSIFSLYNPFIKPTSFQHPRDIVSSLDRFLHAQKAHPVTEALLTPSMSANRQLGGYDGRNDWPRRGLVEFVRKGVQSRHEDPLLIC
jgi:hypothetical protein